MKARLYQIKYVQYCVTITQSDPKPPDNFLAIYYTNFLLCIMCDIPNGYQMHEGRQFDPKDPTYLEGGN